MSCAVCCTLSFSQAGGEPRSAVTPPAAAVPRRHSKCARRQGGGGTAWRLRTAGPWSGTITAAGRQHTGRLWRCAVPGGLCSWGCLLYLALAWRLRSTMHRRAPCAQAGAGRAQRGEGVQALQQARATPPLPTRCRLRVTASAGFINTVSNYTSPDVLRYWGPLGLGMRLLARVKSGKHFFDKREWIRRLQQLSHRACQQRN